jgi:hypothetical protein
MDLSFENIFVEGSGILAQQCVQGPTLLFVGPAVTDRCHNVVEFL